MTPELKSVTVRDLIRGVTYSETYDKLVLSMGAKPVMPLIKGIESERVFSLRDIPDTMKIKNYIEKNKPSSELVAGGGYIGIEHRLASWKSPRVQGVPEGLVFSVF